jgi:hypothetical protein
MVQIQPEYFLSGAAFKSNSWRIAVLNPGVLLSSRGLLVWPCGGRVFYFQLFVLAGLVETPLCCWFRALARIMF